MDLGELTAKLLEALPADAVKLDLGCGVHPAEGFRGVDLFADHPGVDKVDLFSYPWPFADGSVDFFRACHFLEHVPDWDAHFREVYRCLKPKGHYEIIGPFYMNDRAFQDPDHKQPLLGPRFAYLQRKWREANGLTHYGAEVNFAMVGWFELLNPDFVDEGLSADAIAWHKRHSWNVVDDIAAVLRKEPME